MVLFIIIHDVSDGEMLTETSFHRNAGTVRQILESKRNVGESSPATFQPPVNAGRKLNKLNRSCIAFY